jgi:hypothetical protein
LFKISQAKINETNLSNESNSKFVTGVNVKEKVKAFETSFQNLNKLELGNHLNKLSSAKSDLSNRSHNTMINDDKKSNEDDTNGKIFF